MLARPGRWPVDANLGAVLVSTGDVIGCDPANAGTEPPQELLDAYANGGTWGSLDFGTAQTEGGQRASDMESALDGFSEGDFIDAQIRVTNAMFGAFTISQECPWQ